MVQPTPMLHADKFEDMIDRRGRQVLWQEASLCSCWNEDSGQPVYTCKACNGKGFIYQSPITAKAIVTSVQLSQDWESMAGIFEVGDAVMTVPKRVPIRNAVGMPTGKFVDNPMFEIGVNDKITLLDDEHKASEVLARGVGIGHRDADTLLNEHITRVKSISTSDIQTGIQKFYEPEKDYRLNKNVVEWVEGGNAPDIYQQYSVVYFHKPVYVVIATLPKPRHQDGQDLPRYVALRYMSGAVDRK